MTRLRRYLVFLIVLLEALAYCIFYVGVAANWWQPLRRPSGVSNRARYVFTGESAAWFDCSVDLHLKVNPCKAWDPDGNLRASGKFRLRGLGRAATQYELRPTALGDTEPNGNTRMIWLMGPHGEIQGLALDQVD